VNAGERLKERRARHRERGLVFRVGVAVGGFAALAAGLVLLVLPGPGIPLLVVGLGLLALEFRWAEAAFERALRHGSRVAPKRRPHRVLVAGGTLAAAAASATLVLLFGMPF
jgi:uncharacterized protein (TIGR02611 family)